MSLCTHLVRYIAPPPCPHARPRRPQGVGKTTACGKLALYIRKQKRTVLMVATDVYRPAAIDQLVKLGRAIDVPVFELGTSVSPVEIARRGIEEAKRLGVDAVIVDTAGRLQVDGQMMQELKDIKVMRWGWAGSGDWGLGA